MKRKREKRKIMIPPASPFFLLAVLIVMHVVSDFTCLTTPTMIAAKKHGKPLFPIFQHALINGVLKTWVFFVFTSLSPLFLITLFLLETLTHFFFDTMKGKIAAWFPVTEDKTKQQYWKILGIDQALHHMVMLVMVAISL